MKEKKRILILLYIHFTLEKEMNETYSYKISHIYKNIFISDINHSYNINELLNNNIQAILYLGTTNKSQKILDLYQYLNINYKFLKSNDTCESDISTCFEPSWEFINKNVNKNVNILIHCKKGISRSPTIVAYYLTRKMHERMKTQGTTEPVLTDILTLIKMNRPCAKPNKFFIQQLKNYENININLSVK